MALETGIPPWLQRNWAPREPFDPTPWLQERYNRQIEAQKLPLQLQGLQLQNKSAQLAIQHQGMVNEVQGMELQEIEREQPQMEQWMRETGGNPDKILNLPTPAVTSTRNQQLLINAKKMAADSAFGRSLLMQETAKTQRLTALINRGGTLPEPVKDPITGAINYRDQDIAAAERIVDEREQTQRLAQIAAQNAGKMGMSITTNPDGTMTFVQGPANALTVGSKTKLQEQELSNEEALQALGTAITGIEKHPEAIGIRGKVGAVVEKAKGQLNPNSQMDTPIADTQQKASIAFSRIAPALRVDSGNMSKYELARLEEAGYVLKAEEAPQTALNKLRNLQAVVVGKQLRTLKVQGKPIPDSVLLEVQGTEIGDLLKSGLLSPDDAKRLYKLHKNAQ